MSTTTLGAENIERTITENDIGFVDFWAAWCGPCRRFGPVHGQAATAQITSIPTLMVFTGGAPVSSQPGALPAVGQVVDAAGAPQPAPAAMTEHTGGTHASQETGHATTRSA